MSGNRLARAARSLVGAPFRLHGRDAASGVDCLGVIAVSFEAIGVRAAWPSSYALRTLGEPDTAALTDALGLRAMSGNPIPGDVLMVRPGPCQCHFAIASSARSIVHAHASLRRVVEGPLPDDWQLTRHWRLPNTHER